MKVETKVAPKAQSEFGKVTAVPLVNRKMTNWDLFATWIGANANNGTWYIGGGDRRVWFFNGFYHVISGRVSFLSIIGISWLHGIQNRSFGDGVNQSLIRVTRQFYSVRH